MAEQAKKLSGAAAAAAKGKELEGRLNVLAAGLVDRGHAHNGEQFDPVATALDALDKRDGEIRTLNNQLRAQKGQTTKARAAAAAAESVKPAEPRSLGPIRKQAAPIELLAAIEEAEEVEIAFSDGQAEIRELAPYRVTGDAWRVRNKRLILEVPSLIVHGPRPGDPAITIHGYALLIDGKQVAWRERPALTLRASSKVQLRDDITFG